MTKLSPSALRARRAGIAARKTCDAYAERFPDTFAFQLTPDVLRHMDASVKSGIDHPELVEIKRKARENIAAHDRKQAEFLAKPITAEIESRYTALIKGRKLYEGACDLSWARYFEYREEHPECAPLSEEDLAYAGQWTSCAVKAGELIDG
jgi:hypothetical protein